MDVSQWQSFLWYPDFYRNLCKNHSKPAQNIQQDCLKNVIKTTDIRQYWWFRLHRITWKNNISKSPFPFIWGLCFLVGLRFRTASGMPGSRLRPSVRRTVFFWEIKSLKISILAIFRRKNHAPPVACNPLFGYLNLQEKENPGRGLIPQIMAVECYGNLQKTSVDPFFFKNARNFVANLKYSLLLWYYPVF